MVPRADVNVPSPFNQADADTTVLTSGHMSANQSENSPKVKYYLYLKRNGASGINDADGTHVNAGVVVETLWNDPQDKWDVYVDGTWKKRVSYLNETKQEPVGGSINAGDWIYLESYMTAGAATPGIVAHDTDVWMTGRLTLIK